MDAPFLLQVILYYENNHRVLSGLERKALLHLRELLAMVALNQRVPPYVSGDNAGER